VNSTRRDLLLGVSIAAAGGLLLGCRKTTEPAASADKGEEADGENEVTATEDLMREHGVLRRALLVYDEAARKIAKDANSVRLDSLQQTAKLFRAFGEEYHERKLEEVYIFPSVKKAGGIAAPYTDVLLAQHQRGREITDYILATTAKAKLAPTDATTFTSLLASFVRMYEHHTAIEDTIVFPAWKQTLNEDELDELNEKFEDIEHEQFGEDGFENAVKQMGEIETSLGLADLAQFTAPSPPTPTATPK